MKHVLTKLDGYRRWAAHEWSMSRYRASQKRKKAVFDKWLKDLETNPPRVLLGAYFAEFGGIRHHLEAIVRNSAHRVELVPSPTVGKILTPFDLTDAFREEFMNFEAKGVGVVHSQVYPWYVDWCRERRRNGKKWVHTYHLNYYPEHNLSGELEPWQIDVNNAALETVRNADVRIATSHWMRAELSNDYGIECVYIPNAVDTKVCDRADGARFRKQHNIDDFILYVGRDDPVKNPAEFIRLAARMPSSNFVMAGNGLSEDVLRLKYAVETPSNLTVVGGLSQTETQDAIAASKALVVTSKREGLPMLVMEAMAHGKPIVVSNDPGCREVIGDGEAGFVYELGNIDSLADSVGSAVKDRHIGESARKRVLREYAWNNVGPQIDAIYGAVSRI
jgi:glycosyltransferase involved in cell wall biosynthesis